MFRTSFFLSFLFIALSWPNDLTQAESAPNPGSGTQCFRFEMPGSPSGAPENENSLRTETWCYRDLTDRPGARFIFNIDGGTVLKELSAVVDADGTLTHASLLNGHLSTHQLNSNYNPLPVPLSPPADMSPVSLTFDVRIELEAASALRLLIGQKPTVQDITFPDSTSATVSEWVHADIKPWRGTAWSYKHERMHKGPDSPTAKFDRFMTARLGASPGARGWEAKNHPYRGVSWSGHCNGWAASSILRAEPTRPLTDPLTGVTFSVIDQKGLLAEKDNCVKYLFYGRRNNGKPDTDARDIHPDKFHNTLVYYIGRLKKPIIMDRDADTSVHNHVVGGYKMVSTPVGPNVLDVTTILRIYRYEETFTNKPGVAPSYTQTYNYRLWFNDKRQIVKGEWNSDNPDFLWVPLAPADCSPTNPKITEARISEILASPPSRTDTQSNRD